jgi:CBS domain-containing protein
MVMHRLVKEWMTKAPLTIEPQTPVVQAQMLMKERKIRRLPVVQKGNLLGIVSMGDLREAGPSRATTLSIWELNYLWAQLTVERIMTRRVITVSPEATIADAARLMMEHKISGLPVVDGQNLVGIITESDIFRVLMASETERV